MVENTKIIDFSKFCHNCTRFDETNPDLTPQDLKACDECQSTPAQLGDSRPIGYKPKEDN